tara:strand:+ start:388 stop:1026 length:639 start_codon:yes stop_codon:yes gene_type:complete
MGAGPRQQYTGASIYLSPNTSELASKDVSAADRIWFWDVSQQKWTFLQTGTNLTITGTVLDVTGVAPVSADYLVKTADATLTAERVVTDTATITWDWATAGQAKAVFTRGPVTTTSTATLTVNADVTSIAVLTAQAAALTVAAPTGTLVQGQPLVFRFKDNATARAITWNAVFVPVGVTLPTTTVISKLVYVGCFYNSTSSQWDVTAVVQEV